MPDIGIGIVGGGYMGKAHAVAMSAVGAVFGTALRPRLEMVCAKSAASAEKYRESFGFARATEDWRALVGDPRVEAVVIASPQETHREIAEAAFALGKPVFCEKPLGATLADARAMVAAADASGAVNMVGFNYVRTPATQFARQLLSDGAIGEVTWFRGEHTEDFFADPRTPATWRTRGASNGTMGDLAPHMINAALPGRGFAQGMRKAVEEEWKPALEQFAPQLYIVSAGFDAHREDELSHGDMVDSDFKWITEQIMELAGRHADGRIVSTLEGGYALDALARSATEHIRCMMGV